MFCELHSALNNRKPKKIVGTRNWTTLLFYPYELHMYSMTSNSSSNLFYSRTIVDVDLILLKGLFNCTNCIRLIRLLNKSSKKLVIFYNQHIVVD